MEQVFSIMFTDQIRLYLLDEEVTETNVYDETVKKRYKKPIQLIGRVVADFEKGENEVQGIEVSATITIPTKQLKKNNIPHATMHDLEVLRKGVLSYNNFNYLIEEVKPKTLVADMWQFYDFTCQLDKVDYLLEE